MKVLSLRNLGLLSLLILSACAGGFSLNVSGSTDNSGGTVDLSPQMRVSSVSHSYAGTEYYGTDTSPTITWPALPGVNGIDTKYEVAVGTGTSGDAASNAMAWTTLSAETSYTASNLNLDNKQNYYANIRLTNSHGKGPIASSDYWKAIKMQTIELYQKNTTTWTVISPGGYGTLRYSIKRGKIKYELTASGLGGMGITNGTNMTLIYWHDNGSWPNWGMICLGHGAVSSGGLTLSGDVNLGINLPKATDTNYPGAKIWLIDSAAIVDQTLAARGTTCDGIVGATATTTFGYAAAQWNTYKDRTLYENSLALLNYVYEP